MSIKTNFSSKTVTTSKIVFTFDQMSVLQTMLEGSALEVIVSEDETKLEEIKTIAEQFGIGIDLDINTPIEVEADGTVKTIAKHAGGESSPNGLTEAELIAELES